MRAAKIYVILLWVQGIYILLTALWGLIDIDSFMQVTGKKTDIWLVKTVSVLLLGISCLLFCNVLSKMPVLPVIITAIITSAGLAFIDFYYTSNGTIKWVYAIDGILETMFLTVWIALLFQKNKI
jgi:hypothetical protein